MWLRTELVSNLHKIELLVIEVDFISLHQMLADDVVEDVFPRSGGRVSTGHCSSPSSRLGKRVEDRGSVELSV